MNAVAGPAKGSKVAQWRVRDVMTGDVVTVVDDAPVIEVAAVLAGHGISAVPVVDRFDVVVGVVSGTDLRNAVEVVRPPATSAAAGGVAGELVTGHRRLLMVGNESQPALPGGADAAGPRTSEAGSSSRMLTAVRRGPVRRR